MSLQNRRTRGWRRTLRLALMVVVLGWAGGGASASGIVAPDAAAPNASPDSSDGLWRRIPESAIPDRGERQTRPRAYATAHLDLPRLRAMLGIAPLRDRAPDGGEAEVELELPLPDGRFGRFRVHEAPILDPALAAQFPQIRTYSGRGIDDPAAALRLDVGELGLHAFVRGAAGMLAVVPYAMGDLAHYQSYFLRDDPAEAEGASCGVGGGDPLHAALEAVTAPVAPRAVQQSIRRTYRLAVGTTTEYTVQNGGTVGSALSAITARVQGANLIFNAEVGIQLNLVAPAVIATGEPDGYTSGNPNALLDENQDIMDVIIGTAGYDVAQVFDSSQAGGGAIGLATRPAACRADFKARGTSGGNSIVLFVHEMGHMFDASHTFNNNFSQSCGSLLGQSTREPATAMEPGSGSTLMSYAGTCGPADLQTGRDTYFHGQSLDQMVAYIANGAGAACAAISNTGNSGITITDWSPAVTIPDRTPFRLSMRATDTAFEPVFVTWEEVDAGAASPPEGDNGDRAIFRSYPPTQVQTRDLPRLDYVLANAGVPPATYTCAAGPPPTTCLTGEAIAVTTRTLKFRGTARDNFDALNSVDVAVNVVGNSGPFAVGSPNAAGTVWVQGTGQFVAWFPGASADPPIGVDTVKISLSTDGGQSFPFVLADAVPNTGIAPVFVPDVITTRGRVKVEAVIPGNFHTFYDISDADFEVRALAVTNTADSGEGSLRKAILDANSDPGPTTIRFAIGASGSPQQIFPQTPLPEITAPVDIDGLSQGGSGYVGIPLIELRGDNIAASNSHGLVVTGGGSTLSGLSIHRFSGSGIVLRGAGGNVVEFSVIGANPTGSSTEGNLGNGIWIDNSPNNLVGRRTLTSALRPNLIQRNEVGVLITGANASGNGLYSNQIGTRGGIGFPGYGNRSAGVRIVDAPGNLVGGTRPGGGGLPLSAGNTISGQSSGGGIGVHITGPLALGNRVRSNLIGLTPDGTAGLRNSVAGVYVQNAPGTEIGGLDAGEGNALACSDYVVRVDGAASTSTRIQGNTIGTNQAGNAGVQCSVYGVYTEVPIVIGGDSPAARNWISGNGYGVFMSEAGSSGTVVVGNYIGTNIAGTAAVPNNFSGISSQRAGNHRIGGTLPGQGNLVSGNLGTGIELSGATSGTRIEGNFVGTNAAGTAAIPNGSGVGVRIYGGSNNVVGGTTPGARNLISGNGPPGNGHGIRLEIYGNSSGNRIEGNYIGTDVTGLLPLGNGGAGIQVYSPDSSVGVGDNYIGGTTAAARNVIGGNGGYGIWLAYADRMQVQGNYIGVGANGIAPVGNGATGIVIYANRNVIGGTAPGAGNTIANAGPGGGPTVFLYSGVRVESGTGNVVRGNALYANFGQALDLLGGTESQGYTANDACDADTGPNQLQNFPVITAASSAGASTSVSGSLNAAANQAFQIDVYASPDCDATGHGEGRLYLGAITVNTGADCNATFNATLPVPLPANQVATATATDAAGNTSEFSACTVVVGGDAIFANGFE